MVYLIDGLEDYKRDLKVRELADGNPVTRFFQWEPALEDAWMSDFTLFGKKCVWLSLNCIEASTEMERALKRGKAAPNDLVVSVRRPNKRLKVYRQLEQMGECCTCNKLDGNELASYVRKGLRKLNAGMSDGAYQLLVARSCYFEKDEITLYTVNTYLKQLAFSSRFITEEIVDAILPKFLDEDIRKLSGLLFDKEPSAFFELVADLLEGKQEPISMLGMLLRNFRIAYKLQLYRDKTDKQLAELLGLSDWQMRSISRARNLTMEQITVCISTLQEAAADIKTGRMGGRGAFQLAMGNLIRCIC